jgi:hypothetical protein
LFPPFGLFSPLPLVAPKIGDYCIYFRFVDEPPRKTFNAEGAILKQAQSDCLRNQRAALAQLADAARQVDKAAFGSTADFGPAHQALLKALDRAEVLLQRLNRMFRSFLLLLIPPIPVHAVELLRDRHADEEYVFEADQSETAATVDAAEVTARATDWATHFYKDLPYRKL